MIGLRTLGFDEAEVHPVVGDREGRLFVPTTWYGRAGYFQISTSTRLDVCLWRTGVDAGQLPVLRERDGFSVHRVDPFELLGRTREDEEITAFRRRDSSNVFGSIGALFFRGVTIALDPAGPCVGVAQRQWESISSADGFERLPHVGSSGLLLTTALRIVDKPDEEFATLIASHLDRSYASQSLLARMGMADERRARRTALVFPSGNAEALTLDVGDYVSRYAVDIGVDAIDLVLGMNFLRRGYTVVDGSRACTWFRPYSAAAS